MESEGLSVKKIMLLFLCVLLLFTGVNAHAQTQNFLDEMPEDVRRQELEENPDLHILDCLLIKNTPKGDAFLVLSPWYLRVYYFTEGAWRIEAHVSNMDWENRDQLFLRRHTAGQAPGMQGQAGLLYPDDLGFDILRAQDRQGTGITELLQYRWQGEAFLLHGWQQTSSGQFAFYQNGQWVYFDSATGARLGSARIELLYDYGMMISFSRLPATLDAALRMQAITEEAAKTLFPGWKLAYYSAFNDFHEAEAGYYRIVDKHLTIRRVHLSSDQGTQSQLNTMPLPLSERLLSRLQTEDITALIDVSGTGNTFLTEDAFDQGLIQAEGKVLQNDLQKGGLLLLIEDEEGNRHLQWITQGKYGYQSQTTRALPKDASLDLFHAGDGFIGLSWDKQNEQATFELLEEGSWVLTWHTVSGIENEFSYRTLFCGITLDGPLSSLDNILMGSLKTRDLFAMDVTGLPRDRNALMADFNREGWAVVNNPNPKDRLHLRTKPDKNSTSLGKFYNRTPVKVLEQQGEWSRVRIGTDGHLEGFMLSKYLAFGTAMDAVAAAHLYQVPQDAYTNQQPFTAADLSATTAAFSLEGPFWIVGVVEDRLYILLDIEGHTGYMPKDWFFDGNG